MNSNNNNSNNNNSSNNNSSNSNNSNYIVVMITIIAIVVMIRSRCPHDFAPPTLDRPASGYAIIAISNNSY